MKYSYSIGQWVTLIKLQNFLGWQLCWPHLELHLKSPWFSLQSWAVTECCPASSASQRLTLGPSTFCLLILVLELLWHLYLHTSQTCRPMGPPETSGDQDSTGKRFPFIFWHTVLTDTIRLRRKSHGVRAPLICSSGQRDTLSLSFPPSLVCAPGPSLLLPEITSLINYLSAHKPLLQLCLLINPENTTFWLFIMKKEKWSDLRLP